MPDAILVFVNCASLIEGETIAHRLLDLRLIACATLASHMHSYYLWQGEKQESTEYSLILKSLAGKFAEIEAEVRKLHSYEVPEIVGVPITAGSEPYLRWIAESVG